MVGILLITHYQLGESFKACVEHIFGPDIERFATLAIERDDVPEQKLQEAEQMLTLLNNGTGVIVFTDLFGATPANIAAALAKKTDVACLSGVNLPMLVRSVTYRHLPLAEVVEKAMTGGKDGIIEM